MDVKMNKLIENGSDITNIIHLSDIHIRLGTKEESRYEEYMDVIKELVKSMNCEESVINKKALCVITGDIFHNKLKLSTLAITVFNYMIKEISDLMPLIIIIGNHDFDATTNNPDLVTSLLKNNTKSNIFLLEETGLYSVNNVCFGHVNVKDTLISGTSSGKQVEDLPEFPSVKKVKDKICIALFHGTFINSKLQNYTDSIEGYPIEWISKQKYDLGLFGDIHLRQLKNIDGNNRFMKKKFIYGYPGSLIQQNYGEEIINHGYINWNIKENIATFVNIKNEIGFMKIKLNNGWKTSNNIDLSLIISNEFCPSRLKLRIFGRYTTDDINKLKVLLENNKKEYELNFIYTSDIGSEEEMRFDSTKIIEMTNLENVINFIDDNTNNLKMDKDWRNWLRNPTSMRIDDMSIPNSLHDKLSKKNKEINDSINKNQYDLGRETVNFKLKYIEWDHILCFKKGNWFNFDSLKGNTTMINGSNGSGKTSFLETITLSLFGEFTPSKNTHSYSSSVVYKNKPNGEKAYTMVSFEYDNKIFNLQRIFRLNANDKNKLKDSEVILRSDSLDSELSGNKTVSEWITKNIGTIESFLQYNMLSQSNNRDFFSLGDKEQINLIESSQNIDIINYMDDILNSSIKAYTSIHSSLNDIHNNNISNIPELDMDKYKELQNNHINTNTNIHDVNKSIDLIDIKRWKNIDEVDFDGNINNEIERINDEINGYENDNDIDYDDLLISKGKNTYLRDQIEGLKYISYDDDKNECENYMKEYDTQIEKRREINKKLNDLNIKFVELQNNKGVLNNVLYEQTLKINKPSESIEIVNLKIKKYNKLYGKKSAIENNIKIIESNLRKFNEKTDIVKGLSDKVDEIEVRIRSIEELDHPFNPNCEACKKQYWKVDLDNLNRELIERRDVLIDKTRKLNIFEEKKNISTANDSLSKNVNLLKEMESIDIDYYKHQKEIHDEYDNNLNRIDNIKKDIIIIDGKIEGIENEIKNETMCINNLKLSGDSIEKYNECKLLLDNQELWIESKEIDIDKKIEIYNKIKDLKKELVYWKNVNGMKDDYDKFKKLTITLDELKTLNMKQIQDINYFETLSNKHDELDNMGIFIENFSVKIQTIHNICLSFKHYRRMIFNDYIIPIILANCNRVIGKVSDNDLHLKCDLVTTNSKTNSKSKVADKLEWYFVNNGISLPIIKCSGYQRMLMGFAIRVALNKINTKMKINQLFLDESFTSFDSDHLSKVRDLLESLKDDYNQVIIVSHLTEIKDNILNKVFIRREDTYSIIQYGERKQLFESKPRGRKKKDIFI